MKAAIFDMDGVLLDSMSVWKRASIQPLIDNNIKYPKDILNIITPLGFEETAEYFKKLGLLKSNEYIREQIVSKMAYEYNNNISTKPYIYDYLEKLKAEGTKMCILTATIRSIAMPCLERLDLIKYFEFFSCCDELGYTKKDPEIFVEVGKKLGFDIKDITVFDDNYFAVKTAYGAGANVYAVYDDTSKDDALEIKKHCHKYIVSFKDLL